VGSLLESTPGDVRRVVRDIRTTEKNRLRIQAQGDVVADRAVIADVEAARCSGRMLFRDLGCKVLFHAHN